MEFILELWYRLTDALLQILLQPFYYIGILFVVYLYNRQIMLERKLFHTRLHSLFQETWRFLLWGLVGGAAASFAMAFIGAVFYFEDIILLWVISLILLLFRIRFLCIAYSAGVLGILYAVVSLFPQLKDIQEINFIIDPITKLHIPSLLALVGILHLVEALLIRGQGARAASPLYLEGKRGKIVGGYRLQGFWPVPLFLIVPFVGESGASSLSWTPFFGGDLWTSGWAILALPVVIGFTEITVSRLPSLKVRQSFGMLLVYSIVLLALAYLVHLWPVLTLVASLICIMLHEALTWYSKWDELQKSSIYVHDERGLIILGVVPGSPADAMGIAAGEIIHKVNGIKVLTKDLLHSALQKNPAFCKLEIINLNGQSKFINRAIYADDHHELGFILAPDQNTSYYTDYKQPHLFSYIKLITNKSLQNSDKET